MPTGAEIAERYLKHIQDGGALHPSIRPSMSPLNDGQPCWAIVSRKTGQVIAFFGYHRSDIAEQLREFLDAHPPTHQVN